MPKLIFMRRTTIVERVYVDVPDDGEPDADDLDIMESLVAENEIGTAMDDKSMDVVASYWGVE